MLTKDQVWEMFQKVYYDSIDTGDMTKAVSVLHEDVLWSRKPLVEPDPLKRSEVETIRGKKDVEAYLMSRKEDLAKHKYLHLIKDLVFDENRGAFLGTFGEPGSEVPLIAWFETKDDMISAYHFRPYS